ncbi:uncharacterized protein BJ171DRAFT_514780 [Polychytrium aggregatum]|uniref:uncharacterized protein n=1 Tax=Polychytrium aggregatum TaxID=110093 RepID=UPI0022FF2A89|nr:uncharacterized protein BJ171DRAFT_514780 [Polychytrium aggregatum]KAI9202362.1 hypothetical protein BJ171DRAFT_514780 [Polychytrium aggregatum]
MVAYSLSIGSLISMTMGYYKLIAKHNQGGRSISWSIKFLPACFNMILGLVALGVNESIYPQAPSVSFVNSLSYYTSCQSGSWINPTFAFLAGFYMISALVAFFTMARLAKHPNFQMEHQMVLLSIGQMAILSALLVPPLFSSQFFNVQSYIRPTALLVIPTTTLVPIFFSMFWRENSLSGKEETTISAVEKCSPSNSLHGTVYTHVDIECLAPVRDRLTIKKGRLVIFGVDQFLILGKEGRGDSEKQPRLETFRGMFAEYEPESNLVSLTSGNRLYDVVFKSPDVAAAFYDACFVSMEFRNAGVSTHGRTLH